MKRLITILLLTFGCTLLSQAQSKDILAKSAMLNAESSYENGNFRECLDFLKEAETSLGKTNSRIQYMKVKSLIALGTQNGYNKDLLVTADQELKVFFNVTPENSYVPEKYDEMLLSVGILKKNISFLKEQEELAVKAMDARKEQDLSEFNKALTTNTYDSFLEYINKYPSGIYVSQAKAKMEKMYYGAWMKKNLDVDRYSNGDPIPEVQNPRQWTHQKRGAWCYYNNDPSNGPKYGKLYNWYAVTDSRGLCPTGWHVSTEEEWGKLVRLYGINEVGAKLKDQGTNNWESPNTGATNETGFSALPGGMVFGSIFSNAGFAGYWWCNSKYGSYRFLSYNSTKIFSGETHEYDQLKGFSVRCVKDK